MASNEIFKAITGAKKRASEESHFVPMSKIYLDGIDPLLNRGLGFVANVPSFSFLKRTLNRIRHNARGSFIDPSAAEIITFEENILKMKDGNSFLLADKCDNNGKNRILVFGTSIASQVATEKKIFFMDGTFKSASKQFCQIYTIHADMSSSESETNVIPLFYALLAVKKFTTYHRLFEILKEIVPSWYPELD